MLETALMCLALNIYFEARSEPIQGQIAIAEVTLNRVASPNFPNDVCSVVLQNNNSGCQFSWWCDGKSDYPREHNSLRTSKAIAKMMLEEGEYISVVGDEATHYHNNDVHPYWADKLQRIKRVGKHIFYKEKSKEWLRPMARPERLSK
tara:strand:- start:192 stop:635 length:444 start_codon:yes stop_codon:yes gene_type:complete